MEPRSNEQVAESELLESNEEVKLQLVLCKLKIADMFCIQTIIYFY